LIEREDDRGADYRRGEQDVLNATWRHRVPPAWQPSKHLWGIDPRQAFLVVIVCGLGALGALWHADPAWGEASASAADLSAPDHMAEGLKGFQRGDIEGAASSWREAVRLYAETKQPQAHSIALTHLAHAYKALGHYSQAVESLRAALRLAEEVGDRTQVAIILGDLGDLAVATRDVAEAERLLHAALTLGRELGDARLIATTLHTQGNLLMSQRKPLQADLSASCIRTLVFVPDGALRLLPWAALHDGQQFLIEKYALAITSSLTLTEPRPLARDGVRVLAAGMGGAVEDFPPLPCVQEELRGIQRLYGGTLLLDQDFGPERLDTTLCTGRFSMVHIASHSHFAPDAAQSFLITAQGKLTMERLAQVVGRLRFRAEPIELLTLSACETARGDDRAALGLAGVAIQAGARSALATLWLVADEAAAVLMHKFYQHLQEPGMSRACALQQAQRTLLTHPQYADPFFWAPFLLINNWL
jgi:CHAT domain-containing protein